MDSGSRPPCGLGRNDGRLCSELAIQHARAACGARATRQQSQCDPSHHSHQSQCGGFFNLWRGARDKVQTLTTKLRRINKRRKMAAMLSEHTSLPQTPSCGKQLYRKTLAKRN